MDKGYDPAYGARPLRRVIENFIAEPLSRLLLEKKLLKDVNVYVFLDRDKLQIDIKEDNRDMNLTQ